MRRFPILYENMMRGLIILHHLQEDVFHPTTTLLEAIMFQAHMRLDAGMPYSEKLGRVGDLLKLAGLSGKVSLALVILKAWRIAEHVDSPRGYSLPQMLT